MRMTTNKNFRQAKESELPLVWQMLKDQALFANFLAFLNFQQNNPRSMQISVDDMACLGLIGRWRSHLEIGAIKVLIASDLHKEQFLRYLISVLAEEGFKEVVSPPLKLDELPRFYQVGFRTDQRILVLLKTDLSRLLDIPVSVEVRRFDSSNLADLVRIEKESFSGFWRWGEEELKDIVDSDNCNVAFFQGANIGYNVTTIKGWDGTIARLAVLPRFQHRGFGSQMLIHSLLWFQTMNARSVLVTTQETNREARSLYAKFGFMNSNEDRYILRWEL